MTILRILQQATNQLHQLLILPSESRISLTDIPYPLYFTMASQNISITPLLKRLWPSPGETNVSPEEIALAISHIFTDQLSPVQTGALLTCLHFTGWDRRADVIAKCAEVMRGAASQVDRVELEKVVKARGRPEGDYHGGLVSLASGFILTELGLNIH